MSRILRTVVLMLVATLALGGVVRQAAAQDDGTGTVNVLKYYCSYLDQTMQLEAVDTNECAPGAATFTFYLIGDSTNKHQQLVLDGNGDNSITLPVGAYEVVEEGSQTYFNVTVSAGATIQLLVGNPSGEPAPAPEPPTGTVTLQHYLCTYLDSTLLVEAIEQDKCAPAATTFTFYMVGDNTNAYQQATVGDDGQGSIELAAGSYDMVDEHSQTHFDVNVLAGQNIVLLIAGPQAVAAAPTAEPTAAATEAPAEPSAPSTGTTSVAPTKLPSTGAGIVRGSDTALITLAGVFAAMIAVVAIVRRTGEDAS